MVLFFALNSLSEKNKLPTLCTVVVRKVTSVTLYFCCYCNFAEDVIFLLLFQASYFLVGESLFTGFVSVAYIQSLIELQNV